MNKPELSIIIITLNEQVLLPRLLESIKQQDYKNYEIIVADYNSKDRTREIAKGYKCKITDGGGYSTGRNNGARIAKGEYLLFLDADSYLPNDYLRVNLMKLKFSKKSFGTTNVKPISNKYFDRFFFEFYNLFQIITSFFSPHCVGASIFVRKNVFDKVGGFDESIIFAENHQFSKKCKPFGFIILPIPIYTSVRRLDKEGRFKFFIKYIYSGLYRILYKEIDKELFEY